MTPVPRWTGGRVCIVLMSAIGDVVRALPVVNALKRQVPSTHITWIMQPAPASLIRGHPAVDEIIEFDQSAGWRAYRDLRRRSTSYDLVLDLQIALKAGLATAMLKAPVKLGFDRARARDLNWTFTTHQIPPHPVQHVQDQYFEFLAALGVPAEPVEYRLGPWPGERIDLESQLPPSDRPIVTLAIGATHPEKEWFPDRWAELADVLTDRYGLRPVIVSGGSPRERETEAGIAARSGTPLPVVRGLRPVVALIDRSALVISLDTAPLHMAVALDRPVISLWGRSNPKRLGPYRRSQDLIVDAFGDPGEDYPVSAPHRAGRMQRIGVADVLAKVERWRNR